MSYIAKFAGDIWAVLRTPYEILFGGLWLSAGLAEVFGSGFMGTDLVALGCALYGGSRLMRLLTEE